MAHKTDERSFFEWALPDWLDGRATMLGVIFLLVLMALGLLGITIKHLSVDGGRDEIAAGVPALDDPKPAGQIAAGVPALDDPAPPDQIAAAFPGQDDPERLTPPRVDVENSADEPEEDDNEVPERDSGSGISDEQVADELVTIEVPPLFRTGTWKLSVTETGDATCGYPTHPLTYDVTLMIALISADDENEGQDADEDDEDWFEVRIEHPQQIFFGSGPTVPVQVETNGEGYTDVLTITHVDFETGVLEAEERYTAPDGCEADRFWLAMFNF